MNQGRSLPLQREHNPLNINIEFNINGQSALPYPHLQPHRPNIRPYNPSRGSEIPQTDRNTYNRDIDEPKVIDSSKKKRNKRNSMDMNTVFLSKGSHFQAERKKSHLRVPPSRKQEQLSLQKKKSNSKYFVEAYKKSFGEPNPKTFQSKSERKTVQKSLKSIIHKIVYSELSKRSLGKSPYQTHNLSVSNPITSRKKAPKKNPGCRSQRGIQSGPQIVQKLNSLKSMTNSILQSEAEQGEMHCYSKKRERIHIKTEHDLEFIDEIAYYERKAARTDKKGEAVNRAALGETTRIIENFIQQYLHQEQKDSYQMEEQRDAYELEEQSVDGQEDEEELVQTRQQHKKNMKEVLHNQMRQLLGNDFKNHQVQQIRRNVIEAQATQTKSPQIALSLQSEDKIRPYLSSEIGNIRPNIDRQQHDKQQMEKWGYLLDFIRKNIGSSQTDIQAVLQEVYWFLERSKNHPPPEHSEEKPPVLDDDFTVKYSEKRERPQNESEDEDVASFREEYNEENEQLKMLNLDTISNALQQRRQSLLKKKQQELNALQNKRQFGRITEDELQKQSQKVEVWTRKELSQIARAKKSIWKGYHEAKGILDKTVSSKYYEQHHASNTMMKCLSETYLRRKHSDYLKAFQERKPSDASDSRKSSSAKSDSIQSASQQEQSEQNASSERSNPSRSDRQQPLSPPLEINENVSSPDRSEQMQAIRERLMQMKQQQLTAQEKSPQTISYEEVEKELQEEYSDQEMAILNKEVGNAFASNAASSVNKLRYMCAEDKEDIFEFIFLDLCIELYQQPCRENRIMKSINGHVAHQQAQARKKKGVKTNLNVVKEYLKRFISYLLRTSRQSLTTLGTPMGPTALEMLRYMHEGDYDIQDEEEAPTLIVPISLFQKFQQSLLPTLQFEQYYSDPVKQQSRISFLKTVLHIHNKALFDSLNEFLDHERPYGIWGKPFPWKNTSSFPRDYDEAMREEKLRSSMDKVIEQCSYVCGLLVDKQESLVGNAKISEAYVEQIREDRLSRMLANELVQSEQRWLFYDDEETEVLVEMSSYVWNQLLSELFGDVLTLSRRS